MSLYWLRVTLKNLIPYQDHPPQKNNKSPATCTGEWTKNSPSATNNINHINNNTNNNNIVRQLNCNHARSVECSISRGTLRLRSV